MYYKIEGGTPMFNFRLLINYKFWRRNYWTITIYGY